MQCMLQHLARTMDMAATAAGNPGPVRAAGGGSGVARGANIYSGLLAAVLDDERGITPDELDRLSMYRARHELSEADHVAALEDLGWSAERFEAQARQGEEIESYVHVLTATLLDADVVSEEEGKKLAAYRSAHGVSDAMHAAALASLGLTQEAYEASWKLPPPATVETYRERLRTTLASGSGVSDAQEETLVEFRAAHGITQAIDR